MSEPTQHNLIEEAKQAAVLRDGLPRVARYLTTYTDGSQAETQHVLYREGDVLRSMEAAAWLATRGPLPTDPTQQEIDAAIAAQDAARVQALADAAQLRQQIITLAQSAVGVRVDALTAAQVRALFAIVLWQEGALDKNGVVRPLADWIDRRGAL